MVIDENAYQTLLYYISQRERARIGYERRQPKPWCNDFIIQNYRFCNVDRQDDPVTKWIQRYYFVHPKITPLTLWFNIAVARVFNLPECLGEIGYIDDFSPDNLNLLLDARQDRGKKLFNGAYMIHARSQGIPKHTYLIRDVFTPMWDELGSAPLTTLKLETWAEFIGKFYGMGPFMRNQMVADIRYSPYHRPGHEFQDWTTWVEAGPGTIKGLNYLYGRPQGTTIKDTHGELMELQDLLSKHPGVPPVFLDPNNCSNVMCEFSKYMRTLQGTGKPKQRYNGNT